MREQFTVVVQEVRSAWRYRWKTLAATWIVCVIGWMWVIAQPDIFEANARLLVDTSSAIKRILGNRIIEPNFDTKLEFVRQQLLGSVHLDRVARENDLHLLATTADEYDRIIEQLRNRVTISAAGGSRTEANNRYSIRYQDEDPDTAVAVVTTLLNIFMEDSLGAEREGAASARQFLLSQIEEYAGRLANSEQQLANFKRENAGRLPGTGGGYYERLQDQVNALEAAEKQLKLAQSRREQLAQQIAGQPNGAAGGGMPVGNMPPNSIDSRIRDLESRLEQDLLRFTDRHPDILALREQLAELQARRDKEIADLGAARSSQDMAQLSASPIFQALQISLHEAEVQIASINADISERIKKVTNLRSLMDELPDVEAQLARLNRDYDIISSQYQMLVQSLETESLSAAAQETDQLDFQVIDPPSVNSTPVAPNRPRLLFTVLIAGLMAGGGLAFLLSQLNPVFSTSDELREITGRPVLGAISLVFKDQYLRRRKLNAYVFFAGLSVLFLSFGGLLFAESAGIHLQLPTW
jgi:polysaccharide chain length determinant protein (PEP-CTERM system associated)